MTNDVYRSWLTDRGIDSPGSQPFELLASHLSSGSEILILAESLESSFDDHSVALEKLANALSTPERHVSWILVKPAGASPDDKVLKSLLPSLGRIIALAERPSSTDGGFVIESKTVAGKSLQKFLGPSMNQMTTDLELKRRFWNDVRTWLNS